MMTETEPAVKSEQHVVLVTGPSGAGRSTAIRAFEDAGFETIDNMPLRLVPNLLKAGDRRHPLALGIDARNRDFSSHGLIDLIDDLEHRAGIQLDVLFLECNEDVLLRRFSETRRPHPLAPAETVALGIEREADLLAPIRARADFLIDTSDMTPHDLKAELGRLFHREQGQALAVAVNSFSYKRGLPRGADMVFDCRFLRNPYWEPPLRAFNGTDSEVADYVSQDPKFKDFFDRVLGLSNSLLPAYQAEGKSYFSIAFGCTGGQHRSVTLAEKLSKALSDHGWQVSTRHRELERK